MILKNQFHSCLLYAAPVGGCHFYDQSYGEVYYDVNVLSIHNILENDKGIPMDSANLIWIYF